MSIFALENLQTEADGADKHFQRSEYVSEGCCV